MKRQKLCVGLLALILAFASFAPATQVAWAEDTLPATELTSSSEQAKQETGASEDPAAEDSDLPAGEGSEEAAQDESTKDEAELPQVAEAEEKTAEPEVEEKIADVEAENSGAAEEEGEASPENVDAEAAQPEQNADPAQDVEETPADELDQKPAEEEAAEVEEEAPEKETAEVEEKADSEPAEETAELAESSEDAEIPASESADSAANTEDQAAEEDSTEAEADQSITLDEAKVGLTDSVAALENLSAQIAPLQAPAEPEPIVVNSFQELKNALDKASLEPNTVTIKISSSVDNVMVFEEGLTIKHGSNVHLLTEEDVELTARENHDKTPYALFTVEAGSSFTLGNSPKDSVSITLKAAKQNSKTVYSTLINNLGTLTINQGYITGDGSNDITDQAAIVTTGTQASFILAGGNISINNGIGVSVNDGATMVMKGGRVYYNHKAGISLDNGATMEMTGGVVMHNWSGGVTLDKGSTLYLKPDKSNYNLNSDGSIKNYKQGGTISFNYSTGVTLEQGSNLIMTGGKIANNDGGWQHAGGVEALNGSKFAMFEGAIEYNEGRTGGVMVGNNALTIHNKFLDDQTLSDVPDIAIFNMTGGTINNNRGYWDAGGLFVSANAKATMTGGKIMYNATDVGGGGVLVQDGYLVEYAGQDLEGKRPRVDHASWKKAFPASFTMYGGRISGNHALGMYTYFANPKYEPLPVDGDGGGILIWSDNVNLYRGTISGNTARTHGGGIHVKTVPYHLVLKNVRITDNEAEQPLYNTKNAEGQGGGVWVCPIGLVEIYANQGSLIHNNTSNRGGDDFYSMPKAWYSYYYNVGYPNGVIFISSKTLNGEKIVWVGDPDTDGITGLPFDLSKSYKITEAFGLKSLIANPNEAGFWLNITGNHAGAGGGVATNGHLTIGEAPNPVSTDLSGRKELLSAGGRVLSLKGHNFEIERIIGPTEQAYPDILRGYTIDDLLNRVTVEENGTFSFGNIKFTLPGPYVFEVREILGDEKGIIYDPHTYRVTFMVEVDEDNNRLVLADTIIQRYDPAKNPGDPELEDLDELVVTNQVEAEPSSYLPTPEPQPQPSKPVPPPIISKAFIQKLPKTASVLGGQHK